MNIVDTTLREGEQDYLIGDMKRGDKTKLAKALGKFGVDYIELGNPYENERIKNDIKEIMELGLNSKIVCHIRAKESDINAAHELGVEGINTYHGTSKYSQATTKKNINQIIKECTAALRYARSLGDWEIRFSAEDASRSNPDEVMEIYKAVLPYVDRIGFADTTGCLTPEEVKEKFRCYSQLGKDLEGHFHNDAGNAYINAFTAVDNGATHIDVTVNGVGERVGITALQALIAQLIINNKRDLLKKYDLKIVDELEHIGNSTFSRVYKGPLSDFGFIHKAGIHTSAVVQDPESYEIFRPEDFGKVRIVDITSGLVGRTALSYISKENGIDLTEKQIYEIFLKLKNRKNDKRLSQADVIDMMRGKNESRIFMFDS